MNDYTWTLPKSPAWDSFDGGVIPMTPYNDNVIPMTPYPCKKKEVDYTPKVDLEDIKKYLKMEEKDVYKEEHKGIKVLLKYIIDYYNNSRQIGHTTFAINVAKNTQDKVNLVFNKKDTALNIKQDLTNKGDSSMFSNINFISLSDLDKIECRKTIFDNGAIYSIVAQALKEIERLEKKLETIKDDVEMNIIMGLIGNMKSNKGIDI